MNKERMTKNTKSFVSITHRFVIEAPKTFLTPISLVRCSAVNDAKPNRPKQLMKMARIANNVANFPMRCSEENFNENC